MQFYQPSALLIVKCNEPCLLLLPSHRVPLYLTCTLFQPFLCRRLSCTGWLIVYQMVCPHMVIHPVHGLKVEKLCRCAKHVYHYAKPCHVYTVQNCSCGSHLLEMPHNYAMTAVVHDITKVVYVWSRSEVPCS